MNSRVTSSNLSTYSRTVLGCSNTGFTMVLNFCQLSPCLNEITAINFSICRTRTASIYSLGNQTSNTLENFRTNLLPIMYKSIHTSSGRPLTLRSKNLFEVIRQEGHYDVLAAENAGEPYQVAKVFLKKTIHIRDADVMVSSYIEIVEMINWSSETDGATPTSRHEILY